VLIGAAAAIARDTDRRLASGYNHADSRVITSLSAVITRCRDADIMHLTCELMRIRRALKLSDKKNLRLIKTGQRRQSMKIKPHS